MTNSIHSIPSAPSHETITKRIGEDNPSPGLEFVRVFTEKGVHPFDQVEWAYRSSSIYDEKGEIIFHLDRAEVPKEWSQLALDIAASKYLRKAGVPEKGHEDSIRQLVHRVANTIRHAGEKFGGYFASAEDADKFEAELTYMLVTQRGAFNSPVWFNCGLHYQYGIEGGQGNWYWNRDQQEIVQTDNNYEQPQCSACFIQSVDDDLMSMFDLVKNEARVFKYGSGTGSNFSKVRGRQEKLSGGGTSSGLMSFLEVYDRAAGATKSGGTTRRAAKMVCLDMDHPEIVDFIEWKAKEEKKVAALIAAGYSSDFNGEAYKTVSGQNSNNSVRLTNEFMQAYLNDEKWCTRLRTTGEPHEEFSASDLMQKVAEAAWQCADPGVQFDTTINDWHTCSSTDRIYSSNPCSEYMFLNDSACNLASINLLKFLNSEGNFEIEKFRHACRIFFVAQEILVDLSSYPTKSIAQNSHDYRPLGLGYANLGTLLMVKGLPYDSQTAIAWCNALTAILCGEAYLTSAEMSSVKGPFSGYEKNRQPMLRVMSKHRAATYQIDPDLCPPDLISTAQQVWNEVVEMGEAHGYRNAQATVLAPTGTIGLLMDCDTTGIEPDFALVKFKKLAGGGYFKIINNSVPKALAALGYSQPHIEAIVAYAQGTATLLNAPEVNAISLKEKGLTDEEISKIEAVLPSVFELSNAINLHTIGDDLAKRKGWAVDLCEQPTFSLLNHLGFTNDQIESANKVICGMMTLEGAPHLREDHLPIFDCANRCGKYGNRFIAPMGHVKMMSAAQPFISGAISKTINLPNESTVEEIERLYSESWRLGLKAMAIYRDGSKLSQPLNTSNDSEQDEVELTTVEEMTPSRRRLPDERQSITHKFSIAGHEGYLTVGMFEDGLPGEVFLTMSKEGSAISGLVDTIATMTSMSLQYGVPLESLVKKFSHSRFEPAGFTNNKDIPIAKSVIDYVFRWLEQKFITNNVEVNNTVEQLDFPQQDQWPLLGALESTKQERIEQEVKIAQMQTDAPGCHSCGTIMVRNGTCYRCLNCGETSGCS